MMSAVAKSDDSPFASYKTHFFKRWAVLKNWTTSREFELSNKHFEKYQTKTLMEKCPNGREPEMNKNVS